MLFDNIHEVAKALAQTLEAAWGKGTTVRTPSLFFKARKMATTYGPAKQYFQVRVQNGEVVVLCWSSVVWDWRFLKYMEETGLTARDKDWNEVTYRFKVKRCERM